MCDLLGGIFFQQSCNTPLPFSFDKNPALSQTFTAKPDDNAQSEVEDGVGALSVPPLITSSFSKKRTRKPEFSIFIDSNIANPASSSSPKKLKSNERLPLAVRTTSINSTPTPSPCDPDTPFPFSLSDPLWENIENYDARPCLMTPPPTPGRSSPSPSPPSPSSPTSYTRTSRSQRKAQSHRAMHTISLPPPHDMVLYNTLELDDWRATEEDIRAAYKKIARDNHPDKVAEDRRQDATKLMQTVNAAKEVLLNNKRRRAYHKSGKLPWIA